MNGSTLHRSLLVFVFGLSVLIAIPARAQGIPTPVNIRFQGQLSQNGSLLSGNMDFRFSLWDAASGGNRVGPFIDWNNYAVSLGWVNLSLDFGNIVQFAGQGRWLRIELRPTGSGQPHQTLTRLALVPVPYAIHALGPWKTVGNRLEYTKGGIAVKTTGDARIDLTAPLFADNPNAGQLTGGPYFNPENGKTYFVTNNLTWLAAQTAAQAAGLNLATIEDASENEWVRTNVVSAIGGPVWIGLNDVATEGAFTWVDGSSAGFRRWAPGEPNNSGNEDFVELMANGFWNDATAASTRRGLVEIPSVATGLAGVYLAAGSGQLRLQGGGVDSLYVEQGGHVHIPTGRRLYFGAPNENSDPIYFQRITYSDDASGLRLLIGDNTTGGIDYLTIGPTTSTDRVYFTSAGSAFKTGGGTWGDSCDRDMKENISPLTGVLDKVLRLRGYSFNYKPEHIAKGRVNAGPQIGLIAQEVEEVFPDWVSRDMDGFRVVSEHDITALMVESLRELRAEKDAQIAAMADENALLRERLDAIEAFLLSQPSPVAPAPAAAVP